MVVLLVLNLGVRVGISSGEMGVMEGPPGTPALLA